MAELGDEIETKNKSPMENITDKIQHSSSSSESDSDEKKVKYDDDVKKKHHDVPSSKYRLFGREKPLHNVLGGGKPADVLLWRKKKMSAGVVGGATALWVLFELLEYHLVTLVCHVLILVLTVLFLWSNTSKLINKSPPDTPEVRIPEDTVHQVVGALRNEINHCLCMLRDIAAGRDLKKFLGVVAGLWGLYVVGSWCNFLTLFYITFVLVHTVPVVYEKYEDKVDSFAEKAAIEMKKQYAVFDDKVVSKIRRGPLKDKKRA